MMVPISPASAESILSPTGATVSTDLTDYLAGGHVVLTGAGWAADEAVHVVVNNTLGQTWQLVTDVVADGSGGFVLEFDLPNYFVSDYDVTATRARTSGTATTTFTDANPSADLDQCANGRRPRRAPTAAASRRASGSTATSAPARRSTSRATRSRTG